MTVIIVGSFLCVWAAFALLMFTAGADCRAHGHTILATVFELCGCGICFVFAIILVAVVR